VRLTIDGKTIETLADAQNCYEEIGMVIKFLDLSPEDRRELEDFSRTPSPEGQTVQPYVAIIHPTIAIQRLREKKIIPDNWWNAYVARKLETKEATHEQREKRKESAQKVVSLIPRGLAKMQAPKKAQSK
jgi:hypothetical protein